MVMRMSVIELAGVTVLRDGRAIVTDVDWTVHEGERWVVLGPNGAGKSTLLAVISTRLFPTKGAVVVLDEEFGAVDTADLKPRIGLVNAGVVGHIPSAEHVRNVVLTAAWAVTGRWNEAYEAADESRAEHLLEQFGIAAYATRTFGTLSDGERKRTLVARALMANPELLLLDEPAAGLDLGAREELVRRLGALAQDPHSPAVVLITHHVEEIPPGFTHALLLKEGSVVAAGPIADVLTSELLSATFGTTLDVRASSGRWSARAM